MKREIVADTHIHLYDNYNLESFFDKAFKNMEDLSSNSEKILCLTEAKSNQFFNRFSEGESCGKYSFQKTEESHSLKIISDNKTVAYLLNGRQIVTSEGIEVLALATDKQIEDGRQASDVIDALIKEEALVVLGWGVGKWLFGRGELVNSLIKSGNPETLIIGDNSARPPFWGTPVQYNTAEKGNFRVIAGSDPLPFSEEIDKPGTFGIKGSTDFNEAAPSESLKELIRSGSFEICGKRDSIVQFFTRQLRMYTKKYLKKG